MKSIMICLIDRRDYDDELRLPCSGRARDLAGFRGPEPGGQSGDWRLITWALADNAYRLRKLRYVTVTGFQRLQVVWIINGKGDVFGTRSLQCHLFRCGIYRDNLAVYRYYCLGCNSSYGRRTPSRGGLCWSGCWRRTLRTGASSQADEQGQQDWVHELGAVSHNFITLFEGFGPEHPFALSKTPRHLAVHQTARKLRRTFLSVPVVIGGSALLATLMLGFGSPQPRHNFKSFTWM